ncbi:DNA cytosine methyltransferase [Anaerococcus sp. AGMB09787]|uniref:DNA cytosine methyltransferase n=1 Tax=Anaerococcus sp. AGMB09787 TaxID=2922869 RepID=UPI001FAF5098|nr:DNA cytosine methyltransferase [Anaerococcus sp. AGMB09787]
MNNKAISLFAGVGGIDLAFEKAGFETIYANEFDKNARETYKLNFPKVNIDGRDIREVNKDELPKEASIVLSGFPCQSFSIAGYRKGLEDETNGDLFFETLRIAKAINADIIFLENVKNLVSHDKGKTFRIILDALENNGYYVDYKVLNAKEFGNVAQNRERIYVVAFKNKEHLNNFEFPKPIALTKNIRDFIDFSKKQDEKYYYTKESFKQYDILKEEMTDSEAIYQWRRKYVRKNQSGVCPTLTANMGTGGHNVPLIVDDSKKIRKLTPRETFNLQGFPRSYKLPEISNGHLYKQAGNSVVVDVVYRIAKNIMNSIKENLEVEEKEELGQLTFI